MWERSESNWNRQIVPCRPFIREAHSLPSETRSRNWIPLQCKVSFICQIEHILSPTAKSRRQNTNLWLLHHELWAPWLTPPTLRHVGNWSADKRVCTVYNRDFCLENNVDFIPCGKIEEWAVFHLWGLLCFFFTGSCCSWAKRLLLNRWKDNLPLFLRLYLEPFFNPSCF